MSGEAQSNARSTLWRVTRALLTSSRLPPEAAKAVRRHERHVRGKYELRRFLDIKSQSGPLAAIAYIAAHPTAFPPIATGILMDKTERLRNPDGVSVTAQGNGLRYLLSAPAR